MSLSDDKYVVCLNNCKNGLGMKICEEFDENGNIIGVFVKQILENGIAASSGEIKEGDRIYAVNDIPMMGVGQTEAISHIRNAVKDGVVKLVLGRQLDNIRDETNQLTRDVILPYNLQNRKSLRNISGPDARRESFQKKGNLTTSLDSGYPQSSPLLSSHHSGEYIANNVKTISVLRHTSLGVSLQYYDNAIIISQIIEGGDVHLDGRLHVGDKILSINGESFMDIEEARSYIDRLKFSKQDQYRINYVSNSSQKNSILENKSDVINNITKFQQPSITSTLKQESLIKELLERMSDIDDESERASELTSERASELANEITELSLDNIGTLSLLASSKPLWKKDDKEASEISRYLGDKYEDRQLAGNYMRNFSLDANTPIKLEKLEIALKHLGVHISSDEKREIRNRLNPDSNGAVFYGDFVKVTKDVINTSLKELTPLSARSSSTTNMMTSSTPKVSKEKSNGALIKQALKDELKNLRQERDDAVHESRLLKTSLHDSSKQLTYLENEVYRYKKELQSARNQCEGLKRRIRITESTSRSVKQQEIAYENRIETLENELSHLRRENIPNREEFGELEKRSVVLGCQLRKAEVGKRTYEVAVAKLLQYANKVESTLNKEEKKPKTDSMQKKNRKLEELRMGATNVIKVVNSLLEEDPLPYGWEEVYTPDGTKYYINHVNQMTSWAHPVSGVQKSHKSSDPPKIQNDSRKS